MGEVVATIKPQGEPWIVFHGENAAETTALIDGAADAGLYEAVGRATEAIRTRSLLGQHLGATPVSSEPNQGYQAQPAQQYPQQGYQPHHAPQQQGGYQDPRIPQLPPGEPEVKPCPHGGKQWRAGISKQQKPYGGWYCPAPQNQGQCPPEWPKR